MIGGLERPPLSPRLLRSGVLAVIRAGNADDAERTIEALVRGGVVSIELTMTTAGVLDALPGLVARFGDDAELGVGTILTGPVATDAVAAGARFLVTPCPAPDVVAAALEAGVPVIPGGLTAGELAGNWSSGAPAVKLFPAATVGPDYVRHLHGPFPDMAVIPSGGIDIEQIPAWIAAGAVAVSLGGPLVGRDAGDVTALTGRARRAVELVAQARAS